MEELPDLSRLTHEQKDDLIRMLFPLIAQVRQLTARVDALEARLSKNVRALAVHLTEGQLLPLGRSAQLITQLFALTVSPHGARLDQ